jgi:fatty-acyl-CoA synthase
MAGFKVPRHVWVVEDFESIGMTASSKIQKKQLAAHARKLAGIET